MKKLTISKIVITAIMAAIICVLGPISFPLPISPVPISLGVLGIYFAVMLLGWKLGTLSTILYIVLGLVGVPVFAGYSAGPQKLFGPTGGYIVGYIFLSLIAGFFIDKFHKKIPMYIVGMVAGTIVLYAFGSGWLAVQANLTFGGALMAGVVPYIPADLIKMAIAIALGTVIKSRLIKAGLLDVNLKKF